MIYTPKIIKRPNKSCRNENGSLRIKKANMAPNKDEMGNIEPVLVEPIFLIA
jgi:hypothetical protein